METQMQQFVAWMKKIENLQDTKTVEEIDRLHNDWKAAAANFGETAAWMQKRASTEAIDENSAEAGDTMAAFEKMRDSYDAWGQFMMERWC